MEDLSKSNSKYISVNNNPNHNEEVLNPSLVVFPLNYPNMNNLNDEDNTKFVLCQNRDKKRKEDKLLLGESAKMIYEAKTKTGKNLSDYVVAIFSKKKREMKFVDIEGIFSINHKIRRIEEHVSQMEKKKLAEEINAITSGDKGEEKEIKENPASGSYIDNKLQLIKDFGTSKAKKAASGIKAHMVNENNISSVNAVKRILEDTAVKQNLDVQMNEDQKQQNKITTWREILPTFDLDAKDAKNVFDLESSKKKPLNFIFSYRH